VIIPLRVLAPATLALVAVLYGCATHNQNVFLDPPVKVAASSVGQGKVVWVQVKDSRLTKTLGVVGDLQGSYGHISVEHDFSTTVYQRVSAALRNMGFAAQPTPGPDGRILVIDVHDMKYKSTREGLAYETDVAVEVAATARNGEDRYERLFRAGEKQSAPLMPSEKERSEAINRAVGATLEDMLNDEQLVGLLAK